MHLLSVSFRSCRSCFLVCRFWIPQHDPVTDKRFSSDAVTEFTCLRKHTQRSHMCIKGFFWLLILTVEHVTFVRFVCFANREFVKCLYNAFHFLPFVGVVKWKSIEDFQCFRTNAVEKKSDLIGLRLLVYVHYACIVAPRLLEGFPVFCNILFYVEMSWRVDFLE